MSKKILRITKGVPRPNDVTTYGRHALTPRLAKTGYTTYALTMNPVRGGETHTIRVIIFASYHTDC